MINFIIYADAVSENADAVSENGENGENDEFVIIAIMVMICNPEIGILELNNITK